MPPGTFGGCHGTPRLAGVGPWGGGRTVTGPCHDGPVTDRQPELATAGPSGQALKLTPSCHRTLAAIIAADSVEKAAPLAERIEGRPILPANVAQQLRRAKAGGPMAADTMAAALEVVAALEGRRSAGAARPRQTGWPELLRLLETGLGFTDAARGAGVDPAELERALRADADRLSGADADQEAADRGRAAYVAKTAYQTGIMEAADRGEDVRARLAHLQAQHDAGAWEIDDPAADADKAWSFYEENAEIEANPHKDRLEKLLAEAEAAAEPSDAGGPDTAPGE